MRGLSDVVDAKYGGVGTRGSTSNSGGGAAARGRVRFTPAAVGFGEEQRLLMGTDGVPPGDTAAARSAATATAAPPEESASAFYKALTRGIGPSRGTATEPPLAKRVKKSAAGAKSEPPPAAAAATATDEASTSTPARTPQPPSTTVLKTRAAVAWEAEASVRHAAVAAAARVSGQHAPDASDPPPVAAARPSYTIVLPPAREGIVPESAGSVASARVGGEGPGAGSVASDEDSDRENEYAALRAHARRQRQPFTCAACGGRYAGSRKEHEESITHVMRMVRRQGRPALAAEQVGYFATQDSVAYGLVKGMGWEEGAGLGRDLQGRPAPLKATAHGRGGLGASGSASTAAGTPPTPAATTGKPISRKQIQADVRAARRLEARARRLLYVDPGRDERGSLPGWYTAQGRDDGENNGSNGAR